MCDMLLWESFLGNLLNLICIKIAHNIFSIHTNFSNLCSRWNQQNLTIIRSWRAPSSSEIQQSLVHKSGLTKFLQKSPNFFRNFWNFFHILLRSQYTFGTKKAITGTPSKMVLFQKTWWKRLKEYSFNLFTERDIVEDGVAVILPPGLTL